MKMVEIEAEFTNSENERISIQLRLMRGDPGRHVRILVIHDDEPPLGSGTQAPMLLDEGTIEWLKENLDG